MDTLDRVLKSNLCTGCGACAAVLAPGRVRMEASPPGYLRPVAAGPLTTEENQTFEAICPGRRVEIDPGGRDDHPLWGPHLTVRTGHAANPVLRHKASSGGALSAVLAHMLENGAADAVAQTGAAKTPAYANQTVISRNAEEVLAAAGSRYAPSAPLADLDEILAAGDRVVFVGKPCDVAALRAIARQDPRINEKIVLMVAFFCAGVPSHQGARDIIRALGVEEDDLAAFRYRGEGWPGFAKATRRSGGEAKMSYADSWGNILTQHVQARCKICPDGIGGLADLVCADAWECDVDGYPTFDERDGSSLIITRTKIGEIALCSALDAEAVIAEETTAAAITPIQPGQRNRRELIASRLAGMAMMGRTIPRYRGFHLMSAARKAGGRANLKNLAGMIWRIARRRV